MYETVIGLEIHAELDTKTKAFCSCAVSYGKDANTCCCPVCMGLPGAMPKLNKKCVEYAVKTGLALNCTVNKSSYHARKNYFYPDLPKGYQITQGEVPVCTNGYLTVDGRKIRINRIHIEEDAGKLIHSENVTKIDFNRAGVPLIEIVTEPDLRSAAEARKFLEKICEILLYFDVSECKMQEGNIRCDVNVSVRPMGSKEYYERCEMKNINSFAAVVNAIEYEEKRQINLLKNGEVIGRETRRWIDDEMRSALMRNKESAADYRYFPEPDLPCIEIDDDYLRKIKSELPELPDEKRERYENKYHLTQYESGEMLKNKRFCNMLDEAVKLGAEPKRVYNMLVSDVARMENQTKKQAPFTSKELAETAILIEKGEISTTAGKTVIETLFCEEKSPKTIVKEKHLTQIQNVDEIQNIVKKVIEENPKSVSDYKKGKTNAIGFLIGQCMRASGNKANPNILKELMKKELDK